MAPCQRSGAFTCAHSVRPSGGLFMHASSVCMCAASGASGGFTPRSRSEDVGALKLYVPPLRPSAIALLFQVKVAGYAFCTPFLIAVRSRTCIGPLSLRCLRPHASIKSMHHSVPRCRRGWQISRGAPCACASDLRIRTWRPAARVHGRAACRQTLPDLGSFPYRSQTCV